MADQQSDQAGQQEKQVFVVSEKKRSLWYEALSPQGGAVFALDAVFEVFFLRGSSNCGNRVLMLGFIL